MQWLVMLAMLGGAVRADNVFVNPSFEARASEEADWKLDKGGATEASFLVDSQDAGAGDRSACVTIGRVAEWGTQFGQGVDAGQKGRTYTFAVLAKAVQKPVKVLLQIERRAKPYDRAAASEPVELKPDAWTELHVTFKVEKDFREGWFAYISCDQANCAYRADLFRLQEGDYVPYNELAKKSDATGSVHVFDVGSALTADAIATRENWKAIAANEAPRGDLCVVNDQLALVLRKEAAGAECFYKLGAQWIPGPHLTPMASGGERAQKMVKLRVIESSPGKVIVEATTKPALTTRYLIRRNQPMVEVQPGEGMARLRIDAQSQYAVLPDIFGGDLVVEPSKIQAQQIRFPSERLLAQLLPGGNAIVACAWRSPAQGAKMALNGSAITGTEIQCNQQQGLGVWVSVLAAPGIWYREPIAQLDHVKDVKPDWQIPFRALWRADYQRTDGLIDSWKCIIKKGTNDFEGFGVTPKKKSRTVWTSTRGTFAYPVCVESNNICLRNTKFDGLPEAKYDATGHVILYPFRRISGSPETVTGVFDVLADALQNTSDAAVLDDLQIKRVARDRYPATCAVTAEYEKIFADKEERKKKAELLKRLDDMDHFCIGIRSRMDEFLAWEKKTHEFCAQTKAAKPQLAALVDELDGIIGKFSGVYTKLKLDERTPAAARAISDKVSALIDSNAEKKDEQANQFGRATRTIGGSQDESIGRFRTITRELRQRAGQRMLTATDEDAFEFARAMRERTLEMLQSAFGHEGASTE